MGHLIHIDFGFILGISPGGNLGFETASFKLTTEMVELLGGASSDAYHTFVLMAVRGFLAARHVMEPILACVSSFADSGLPCFTWRKNTISSLRERFFPLETTTGAGIKFRSSIERSRTSLSTKGYDAAQFALHSTFY
jgi:phosphatidylinositol 4-kinase